MRVAVRAPGKALLCGEYAVLRGAPAVVMAVDRRAHARFDGATNGAPEVSTVELYRDGRKLGLGSSAASVVAEEAARRLANGGSLTEPRARDALFRYCLLAHAARQGVRGSGADVAAAVFGGVLEVLSVNPRQPPVVAPSRLPGIVARFYWTGRPASTPDLVTQVLGAEIPETLWDELASVAWAFADGCQRGDGRGAIDSARHYGSLLAQMATHAGVAIVPAELTSLEPAIVEAGGALKTSGAGGGDLLVALLPEGAPYAALDEQARRAGLEPLDLAIDPLGVTPDPGLKPAGPSPLLP